MITSGRIILSLVTALAGCGSSVATTDPFQGYKTKVLSLGDDSYNAVLNSTVYSAAPPVNLNDDDLKATADLSGYLSLFTSDENEMIMGIATATANFDTGKIVGSANSFASYSLSSACNDNPTACSGTKLSDYSGSAEINGDLTEVVSGSARFEKVGFTADGTIFSVADGLPIVIDIDGSGYVGRLDGKLFVFGEDVVSNPTDTGTGGSLLLTQQ